MEVTSGGEFVKVEAVLQHQADFLGRNHFLELGIDQSLVHALLNELDEIQRVALTAAPRFALELGAPAANAFSALLYELGAYEIFLRETLEKGRGSVETTRQARLHVNTALSAVTLLLEKKDFGDVSFILGDQEVTEATSKAVPHARATVSPSTALYPRDKLLEILTKRFSIDEIRDLSFQLEIDHEDLDLSQSSKSALARALIEYTERRERYDDLASKVAELRPGLQLQYGSGNL